MNKPLIDIRGLSKTFKVGNRELTAVDALDLTIHRGETLGLVGESGCGKSTVGRTLIGLHKPTSGTILYDGAPLSDLSNLERRRKIQMVFQDPYASLNPRMTVQDIIGEPLDIHRLARGAARKERVAHLLRRVGLSPTAMSRFPHEFSGGQRQRIGIARALAVEPEFLILDEPISALDVSIQAQIVNLLKELQREMGLTYLLIAHDLSMIKYISDRVAVMYLGHLVELAPSETLYRSPRHPYTQALLSAIPVPDPEIERKKTRIVLQGELPNPIAPPSGCPFRTRCPLAQPECAQSRPSLDVIGEGQLIACHRVSPLSHAKSKK